MWEKTEEIVNKFRHNLDKELDDQEERISKMEAEIQNEVDNKSWRNCDSRIKSLKVLKAIGKGLDKAFEFIWPTSIALCYFVGFVMFIIMVIAKASPDIDPSTGWWIKSILLTVVPILVANHNAKLFVKHFKK